MSEVKRAAINLVKLHRGLRAASRATGIDPAYLSRLQNGKKSNPSEKVLKKLGLKKAVTYTVKS
jgi:transcriptional regulator with XRE-family HTH domain